MNIIDIASLMLAIYLPVALVAAVVLDIRDRWRRSRPLPDCIATDWPAFPPMMTLEEAEETLQREGVDLQAVMRIAKSQRDRR